MSDNIKVVVKVRPLISRELEDKQQHQWRVQNNTLYQLDSHGRDYGQAFTFDKIYNENTKTTDVYDDVAKPIVEAATAGFNGTIFAYGQTSSGKTYTMTGTESSPGIIPLSVLNLFEIIKNIPKRDFLVRVSYIEIYNETVKDLLDVKKENIKVHETYEGCIKVDASERVTSSPEEVLEAMREGEANRQTGSTNMNEKSSRSHSIFQITIESREHTEGTEGTGCVNVSQLNLVDLAGSERAGQTGATGLRFKEGTHINKSLSALALVIKQLSEGPNKYANYRDSKLTRILQNSLGGNAKTSIICAVTPAALEETVSTLQFATRAKTIKNKPEVNAVATDATMIQQLTRQLSRLQSQLESKKNLEVMLENKKHVEQDLQKQIVNLQRLILNGFGQRTGVESLGARRKQPPRRITISTLHAIDEDPPPPITKFCTPTLKYNPMVIPNPSEFVPIQSSKLASLPEEPPRLVTPPPPDKKVNFNDEVIEIDSDDDNTTIPTCSPYHKCYSQSKTPPCILRKNCHRAEKNYREIVEFTEREKMFKPDVVELMEKLESSTNMATKLQEEMELLRKNSKERDLEMEHLLFKVRKTEEDIKNAKLELEARSQEFKTKLTDSEVSYEILQRKAKLREEELLSLLEEQKLKKHEDIGKLHPIPVDKDKINYMDMSKDISLVNSDNESSIITSNEEDNSELKKIVTGLQDQLIEKCQIIVQLEANIASQKLSIEYLEQSSHELQSLVDSFKEKNNYLENENMIYKSNIDELKHTIKEQKENLIAAQNDMTSYNNIIEDLQIKLTKKDDLLNITVSDSMKIENMIINEEKVIANNENIKNIIHSFKVMLDKRNKEIELLKSTCKQSENSSVDSSNDNLEEKVNQINILNEENFKLKNETQNNIITINNLLREKSNLVSVEEQLTKKITELENHNMDLKELNRENNLRISNLNETNEKLLEFISEKKSREEELVQLNKDLQSKLEEMLHKITLLEKELNEKSNIISSLSIANRDKQEYENHAKSALDKLKSVITILSGDIQEIPEFIENCVTLFNALSKGLSLLEDVATDTISEKSVVANENSQLKSEIINLQNKFDSNKTAQQHELDELKSKMEMYANEITNLKEINTGLEEKLIQEKDLMSNEYDNLLAKFDNFKETANKLNEDSLQKQLMILSFKENETIFKTKINDLTSELQNTTALLKTEQDELRSKTENLSKALDTVVDQQIEIENRCEEIERLKKCLSSLNDQDQYFKNISNKIRDIANNLNIENSLGKKDDDETILTVLDKIQRVCCEGNIKQELVKSKKSVQTLTDTNQALNDKVSELENKNKTLYNELENNNLNMENLSKDLSRTNELLEELKKDVENKVLQIQAMERKMQDCKDQFTDVDILMNQKMQDLRNENEMLKARHLSLENESHRYTDSLKNESHSFPTSSVKSVGTMYNNKQSILKTTPPSLLTICCNKIVDVMEPKQNDPAISTPSSSNTEIREPAKCETCVKTSLDLRILEQEKHSLIGLLEQSERTNKDLLLEQENIRQEIQLLVEPAQELQKKLSSHKTNLSILTATTYAENRSLKSQVLALRHHHSKLLNVCEGDIPEFKKQLRDLFAVLKSDPSTFENQNLKRYSLPDVLDNNTTVRNFKNESTLDGDMLMLDTNITLTTTGDNTLVGYDQTCLDLTQTIFNELSCQTIDPKMSESNIIDNHQSILENDSQKLLMSLEVLKEENNKLKSLIDKFSDVKVSPKIDAQNSPIKAANCDNENYCIKCKTETNVLDGKIEEIKVLSKKLEDIQIENQNINKKYDDIVLEMPKVDTLINKLQSLEKEYNLKSSEVTRLTSTLNNKNRELKQLQEENDSLSTQVMENISEADDLNKELHRIKSESIELTEKIHKLESTRQFECPKCQSTVIEATSSITNKDNTHTKLNRSLSDSETSSRFNKICTLQSELYAGREDCRALTEHVATIKQHLNCSNISMDLDESIGDANVSHPKNYLTSSSQNTMPDIQEEQSSDVYAVDKMDCYNYYLKITAEEKEEASESLRIIDILKKFHNNMLEKHGNEVAILADKLKEYEDLQNVFQAQTADMATKYSTILKTLEEREENLNRVSKFMSQMKTNVNRINNEFNIKGSEVLDTFKIVSMFKQNFLNTLDYEFGISSTNAFEIIIAHYEEKLNCIQEQSIKDCNINSSVAHVDLEKLKKELAEKESEQRLIKAQNEKIREISSAVTLEIVKNNDDLRKSIKENCEKLIQCQLITHDFALTESAVNNINIIFDHVIHHYKNVVHQHQIEIKEVNLAIKMAQITIDEKEKEVTELKLQIQSLRDINNNITIDLTDKETKLQSLKAAQEGLSKAYDGKIQENINKLNEIDKLTDEINNLTETINHKESVIASLSEKNTKTTELLNLVTQLKEDNSKLTSEISDLRETLTNKDALITSLSDKNAKTTELLLTISELQEDNAKLKTINQMISQEKESYGIELEKSIETNKQNIAEIEKMTSDILILRESVKDATSIIESLKEEVHKLSIVNAELKQSLEEKARECTRLEINMKTHVKTTELQSKMIIRLNKQKEEDDIKIIENQSKINEVNEKYNTLQAECEKLKNAKVSLEARVSELQEAAERPRTSLDAADSRRRRQSIHDSKRLLRDVDELNVEEVFDSRTKPDDLFSEGEDLSGRGTPFGNSRGHDSLLSRTEQSDKDEDHSSRPSSVQATRRRRQSSHDMHRDVAPLARHTPSPHDLSSRIIDEIHHRESTGNKSDAGNDARCLRAELASCRRELSDLQERYRELDEECETCAQYLRERDDQCARLKREKTALEKQISELKSISLKPDKPDVADVAVNTDEDWANLHAVVVDRMSYDVEVEKNKRLARTVEELRFQKQDLKSGLARLQAALDKQHASKDNRELEATKKELKSVREELEELKVKYKELDDECETCAEYLKEREEQCRRLKEAKTALESKLQELQEDSHALAQHAARKKRQTAHDKNRSPGAAHCDAASDTLHDLLSSQVERDNSASEGDENLREIKRLKKVVHQLTHQKASVEQQLKAAAAPQPMLVATGSAIVQNQQLTDVMKENQRLKKINAKLVNICKKRGKSDANRENEDPCEQG